MAIKRTREELSANPSKLLSDLLDDYVNGNLDRQRTLYKVLVVDIDAEGGNFEKNCPKKSIRGRVISENWDTTTATSDLNIFWPLFSEHLSLPVKCGEIVWCVFDDKELRAGWWLDRVRDNKTEMLGLDDRADVNRKDVKETPYFHEEEEVPLVPMRPDDHAVMGDQGQYIRLGRDRTEGMDTGGDGAVIDIIVGPDGNKVDFNNDAVRIYLAERSDNEIEGMQNKPIAAIIADNICYIAREKFRVVIKDSESYLEMTKDGMTVNGTEIKIGENAEIDPAVLGDKLQGLIRKLVLDLVTHIHPSGTVSTGTSPIFLNVPSVYETKIGLDSITSKKTKVE